MKNTNNSSTTTRRNFMKRGAIALTAPLILPKSVFGANEKVNLAWVGFENQGWGDLRTCASGNNVVALCDCDSNVLDKGKKEFGDATCFDDFRVMLDKMGSDIDAVGIGTPDHNHFPIAYKAITMGKHVFVQKPLVQSLWQCRTLEKLAKEKGVVTQMGNQAHAWEQSRLIKEWYEAGLIGEVKEVHTWTNRPAQGYGFPQHPAGGLKEYAEAEKIPGNLDWNLWLGPTTQDIEYNQTYHPKNWRPWWDFGCGGLGDIGCHTIDAPWWALELGAPEAVEVEMKHPGNNIYTPDGSIVNYKFAARGDRPPVSLKWYEAPSKPERPEGYDGDIWGHGGMIMVGSEGGIAHGGMRPNGVHLYPKEKWEEYKQNKDMRVPKSIPRVKGIHHDWLDSIKNGKKSCSDFSYSGPLTEVIILGTLAIRTGNGLGWDPKELKVKNNPAAAELVRTPARKGWRTKDL